MGKIFCNGTQRFASVMSVMVLFCPFSKVGSTSSEGKLLSKFGSFC